MVRLWLGKCLHTYFLNFFRVTVLQGNVGQYAINFQCDGAYSKAIIFKTNFLVSKVYITKYPTSSFKKEIGHPVGFYLNQVFNYNN